jgi:hypothetical protein
MNIIFGSTEAKKLTEKYTVLELDTIQIGSSKPITAYCVVQDIPFEDFPSIPSLKLTHFNLMENYKNRNWDICMENIDLLIGKWGGQLDTFYTELNSRISKYKINEPDDYWTGIIFKKLTT